MRQTPRAAAEAATANAVLPPSRGIRGVAPPGDSREDERVAGYGVMGLPFASGHYLALRCWTRTWMGTGYRSVWHRDLAGTWTIYATVSPERGCARYLSSATAAAPVTTPIDVSWTGPGSLHVAVGDVLAWDMEISGSAATRFMSGSAALMPASAWNSKLVTRAMGQVAWPLLDSGRVPLAGRMPNGQRFLAAPQRIWAIVDSRATLRGADLGPVGPLAEQDRLGDFWLPQRGMFAVGWARFEAYDPARHEAPDVGTPR